MTNNGTEKSNSKPALVNMGFRIIDILDISAKDVEILLSADTPKGLTIFRDHGLILVKEHYAKDAFPENELSELGLASNDVIFTAYDDVQQQLVYVTAFPIFEDEEIDYEPIFSLF